MNFIPCFVSEDDDDGRRWKLRVVVNGVAARVAGVWNAPM